MENEDLRKGPYTATETRPLQLRVPGQGSDRCADTCHQGARRRWSRGRLPPCFIQLDGSHTPCFAQLMRLQGGTRDNHREPGASDTSWRGLPGPPTSGHAVLLGAGGAGAEEQGCAEQPPALR